MSGLDGPAVAAIAELARDAAGAEDLELGKYHIVPTEGGVVQIDLTGDQWRDYPKRKRGTVQVANVAAFAHYYGRHADEDSEVFADLKAGTVTAILDAHHNQHGDQMEDGGARWQQHRLVLTLEKTPAWQTWMTRNRQMMAQEDFAEFLEEHATDVHPEGPVSAGDLLDIAQFFAAHTELQFTSGKRLHDGQTQLQYTEQTTTTGRGGGNLEVPAVFDLAIAPYEDCPGPKLTVRLRYRLNKQTGAVTFGYFLDNPERRAQDAVREIAGKIAADLGVTVMHGTPAPAGQS